MHHWRYLTFLASLLSSTFAVPVTRKEQGPAVDNHKVLTAPPKYGDFVGVRPVAYEQKTVANNRLDGVSVHPGVVIDGPHAGTGKYSVAMISKKLPHNPPQKAIEDFHPKATVYGNVDLSPPKHVSPENMRIWISDKTGKEEVPMAQHGVKALHEAMAPHTDWRPPTPPSKPPTPPPKQRKSNKAQANRVPTNGMIHSYPPRPQLRTAANKNVASSSRHPLPPRPQWAPSHPAANRNVASSSKHPLPPRPLGQGTHGPSHPPANRNVASSSKHQGHNGSNHQAPRRPLSPKRPGSPSKKSTSPGPRPQSRQGKGKGPASPKRAPGLRRHSL